MYSKNKLFLSINISLIIYFFFSLIFLFEKSKIASDFSISEMLINYNGGFTRRGLIGQIFFNIHENFNIKINNIIFFSQIFFCALFSLFLILIFKKIKNQLTILDLIILFLPTLLFYPLYELEALGRKEILIFISFSFLILQGNRSNNLVTIIYSFLILPVIILTWEMIMLYLQFYFVVFYYQYKVKTFTESFKIFLIFVPSLITFIFIWLNPLDIEGHKIMCETINCYGASSMLVSATIYFDTWWIHDKANFLNYLRFFVFFIISILPFIIFSKYIIFREKKIYIFKYFNSFFYFTLFLFFPTILIFLYGLDWGRWLNIFITLNYLLFLFFRISKIILIKEIFFFKKIKTLKLFFLIFFYCFSWNPKILLWEDTGSLPIIRTLIKSLKILIS